MNSTQLNYQTEQTFGKRDQQIAQYEIIKNLEREIADLKRQVSKKDDLLKQKDEQLFEQNCDHMLATELYQEEISKLRKQVIEL